MQLNSLGFLRTFKERTGLTPPQGEILPEIRKVKLIVNLFFGETRMASCSRGEARQVDYQIGQGASTLQQGSDPIFRGRTPNWQNFKAKKSTKFSKKSTFLENKALFRTNIFVDFIFIIPKLTVILPLFSFLLFLLNSFFDTYNCIFNFNP